MANQIRYNISVTPIETVQSADGATNYDIIAGEVAGTLGGSGTSVVTDYHSTLTNAKQGFGGNNAASGVKYYVDANDADDATSISAETAIKFLFIKNTGYTYSSASALGAASTLSIRVTASTTTIAVLDPGECLILKDDNGSINGTDIHCRTVNNNGSTGTLDSVAVEFLAVK